MSERYTLNTADFVSILKGAAINFGGAVLLAVGTVLQDGSLNWGAVQVAVLTALGATLVNIARKLLQGPGS